MEGPWLPPPPTPPPEQCLPLEILLEKWFLSSNEEKLELTLPLFFPQFPLNSSYPPQPLPTTALSPTSLAQSELSPAPSRDLCGSMGSHLVHLGMD